MSRTDSQDQAHCYRSARVLLADKGLALAKPREYELVTRNVCGAWPVTSQQCHDNIEVIQATAW